MMDVFDVLLSARLATKRGVCLASMFELDNDDMLYLLQQIYAEEILHV